jgi:hypothetical protein
MRLLEAAPERWEVQLQALWAVVALAAVVTVLAVACMAARAAQAVAATSLEAARLTAAAAVHASEGAGARAAATLAAALGEPASRSAQAAERFAESMHDFRRVHSHSERMQQQARSSELAPCRLPAMSRLCAPSARREGIRAAVSMLRVAALLASARVLSCYVGLCS